MPDGDRKHPDERLWSIAGAWDTRGTVAGDPPVPVVGTDTYEILPGGYFLVHHVDVMVGTKPVRAIEIIGEPDPTGGGFLARAFDGDGNTELMRVTIDEAGVFHFYVGPEIAPAARPTGGGPAKVRSTLTVAEDRRSMTALWERSDDGRRWRTWMSIGFSRKR